MLFQEILRMFVTNIKILGDFWEHLIKCSLKILKNFKKNSWFVFGNFKKYLFKKKSQEIILEKILEGFIEKIIENFCENFRMFPWTSFGKMLQKFVEIIIGNFCEYNEELLWKESGRI